MGSSEDVTVLQRVIDARLVTRSDRPDVGVLAVLHGFFMPVGINDLAAIISPQICALAGTVIAFPSEAEAWRWLEQHSKKGSGGDGQR